jgi:hypothetical protein
MQKKNPPWKQAEHTKSVQKLLKVKGSRDYNIYSDL